MATEPTIISPAEHLFNRRLALARELSCASLFEEIAANDRAIADAEAELTKATLTVKATQTDAEETEALLALGVEGKNETERKARRVEALRSDPAYQSITSGLRMLESSQAEVRDRLEALKRNGKRLTLLIEYRIAILRAVAE